MLNLPQGKVWDVCPIAHDRENFSVGPLCREETGRTNARGYRQFSLGARHQQIIGEDENVCIAVPRPHAIALKLRFADVMRAPFYCGLPMLWDCHLTCKNAIANFL